MAKTEVWKNKTKYCWIGRPKNHPAPFELQWFAARLDLPPGVPVECRFSRFSNSSNNMVGVAIGPEELVRAELKSLGITQIDEKQTQHLPSGDIYLVFRGIGRCLEDVSKEFASAVEGFKLGGLEAAKQIVGKDKKIEELQAELAASRKAAADKEAEIAALKAVQQKSAAKRLGL